MPWEELTEDVPEWLSEKASQTRNVNPDVVGTDEIVHGDTYIYKIEYGFGNHGREFHFYRQLKSDYFDTNHREGTCPNCQEYVRRLDGDDVLTCHRCGWQYPRWRSWLGDLLDRLPRRA